MRAKVDVTKDWKRGVLAAADVADSYNACTTHAYRLGDCVAGKLNAGRTHPRRNTRKLQKPENAWVCGFVLALAEMHRRLINGNDSTGVCAVAKAAGVTIASAKLAGADSTGTMRASRQGTRETRDDLAVGRIDDNRAREARQKEGDMGSTLNVNLCPHKVCRAKYGCPKCDAEAACERCRGTGYVVTPEGRSWCTCENGKRVSSVGAR